MTNFHGSNYEKEIDGVRLTSQIEKILDLMIDGKWRTLREIEFLTGYPAASISAQLRNLRKECFGSFVVDKRKRGDRALGLFEYRLEGPPKIPVQKEFTFTKR